MEEYQVVVEENKLVICESCQTKYFSFPSVVRKAGGESALRGRESDVMSLRNADTSLPDFLGRESFHYPDQASAIAENEPPPYRTAFFECVMKNVNIFFLT